MIKCLDCGVVFEGDKCPACNTFITGLEQAVEKTVANKPKKK
jgi:rubrerythrin